MLLDRQLEADITALFPDRRDAALAAAGLDSTIDPSDRNRPLDTSRPLADRILAYEKALRDDLHLCARQVEEFPESDPYVLDLRGQGMAILIGLRELRRHFPELLDAGRQGNGK
jgi:hypothetical protein